MSLPEIYTCQPVPSTDCPFHHQDASVSLASPPADTTSDTLFSVFDDCLNRRSHLLLEVGYNRVTDWMVHIFDSTGVGIKNAELIISVQSHDRKEAMTAAIDQLRQKFLLDTPES